MMFKRALTIDTAVTPRSANIYENCSGRKFRVPRDNGYHESAPCPINIRRVRRERLR